MPSFLYDPLIRTYESLIFIRYGAIHYVWWIRRGGCRVRTECSLAWVFDMFCTLIRGVKGRLGIFYSLDLKHHKELNTLSRTHFRSDLTHIP